MAELPNEFLLYQAEDGQTRIDVRVHGESVWLSLMQIAALFQRDKSVISRHISNIYAEGELDEAATVARYATVQTEGSRRIQRDIEHYNLDMIIAVGFRVRSKRGTQFRQWANARLGEYIVKGFAMDDERLSLARHDYFDELVRRVRRIRVSERRYYQKITDIFATSVDYDPKSELTKNFFATVQNKFHYAIHGMTAPEVIKARADATQPLMGMTSFKGVVPTANDATSALNYLSEAELRALEDIADQYGIFAENQALRRIPMNMADWITKLHGFLTLNDRDILQGAGKVSRKDADTKALAEFEKYRIEQDRTYISDFDRSTKKLLGDKPKADKKGKPE
ncbi:MAG: RhuM family protein [Beijerinckiaceae bacterium]|jgi:hypothetical protein|nr:RhuM family protein [Beijerinckiaceae bacterium]